MRSTLRAVPVLLMLAVSFPAEAWACPMCFDANAENRWAFLKTAIFLTVLPLGMVGTVGLWLRARARELDEAVEEEEAPPAQ